MKKNRHGDLKFTEDEVLQEIYDNPIVNISNFLLDNIHAIKQYNDSVRRHYEDDELLQAIDHFEVLDTDHYDEIKQSNWYMPVEYREMDIAAWVLTQCSTEQQLQRCGDELIMFYDRDMESVLQYLKYFVDTMRTNKKVWGVGRGSSVASYVLYIIGVHSIDSLYYGLDIKEFLR